MNLFSKLSLKKIKYAAFILLDQFMMALPMPRNSGSVLLIRYDGIGDFVLWLDASRAITKHYHEQGRKVTLLANSLWSGWAAELGVFDEVLPLDILRFDIDLAFRVRTALQLRKKGFAKVIQPIYSRIYMADFIASMSGASERIAWIGENSSTHPRLKAFRDRWYTRLLKDGDACGMEILRNADFVRQVADGSYIARMPDLREFASRKRDDASLKELGSENPFYVLFPGAGWTGKQWSTSKFAALAQRLYEKTGWHGVICGSTADSAHASAICVATSVPLTNLSGLTDLSQLTKILSQARLVVSNDTAAIHIAAAVGTPSVCILGGGHFGRFLPYQVEKMDERPLPLAATHMLPCFNCNWNCIFPVAANDCVLCIEGVDIDNVWKLVLTSLEVNLS